MIRVQKIQIPALPTQKARRLYIWLPRDYARSGRRYPVLYMFDGHNIFFDSHATYGKSWGMREYLEKTKPPLILVAVACNPEGNRRLSEYAPWNFSHRETGRIEGCGKLTMDWITQELKPTIDQTYRTLPDREHTLIAGSSMGGLMAIYALCAYNGVFSRAAALSPFLPYPQKSFAQLFCSQPLQKPTQLYMDMGSGEAPESERSRLLGGVFTLADRLSRAGADVTVLTAPGALHNEAAWERRIPFFLPYLLDTMTL